MSILVQDQVDGEYKLYIKGADSIIQDRLVDKELPQETQEFLKTASTQGLRTLLLGMKVVDEDEVREFQEDCDEAARDLENKDVLLELAYN